MEENVKRSVAELSDIVKNLKSKYPEVEKARESLLIYAQDQNAYIPLLEKKVKQLEDALSLRNAKKRQVIQAIDKIREALRVQQNGKNDVTESREDKGRPPCSPALPGNVTPMKSQEAENQLPRPPGSPALSVKGTPVKGQGEEKQLSRPQGSPALDGKGTPVKGQGEEKQFSSEMKQLKLENQYLKMILENLHRNIIAGEALSQKEDKPPEGLMSNQTLTELSSKTQKVTHIFYELETELDYVHRRISQLSSVLVGVEGSDVQVPFQEKINIFTAIGRKPRSNPTSARPQTEQSLKLNKDFDLVTSALIAMKEKERETENRMRETVSLQSIIDSLHKESQDLSKDENRNDSSSPLDQVESSISKDSSIYQSLTKAREIINLQVECKRLAEYATRLLEELSNFSHTRKESNSIVLSEPPKVTSQTVDKKNLKKTEKLREKSEESAINEKLKRNYENACNIHSQMKEKENLRVSLEGKVGQLEVSNKRLNDIQDQNTDLKKEVDSLRLRLSELSGAKLSHENPDIADLSDPNRPTKLGEKYSEIYANQWTDAFAALSKQTPEHTDDERILYLYDILVDGYHFCKGVRRTQILSLEELMLYPADVRGMETRGKRQKKEVGEIFAKSLSDAAKLSSNLSSDNLVKTFLTNKETKSKFGEDMKLCEAYIEECIRLCWHMQVHTPPLCLDLKTLKGQPFVKETYKEYSATGKKIAFIVWPALFLHEKGPLIAKGVAQGM